MSARLVPRATSTNGPGVCGLELAASVGGDERTNDCDLAIHSTVAPWVPPGVYEAVGRGHSLFKVHQRYKLKVDWALFLPDQRILLPRFYNIAMDANGRAFVGPHGAYAREWARVARRRRRRSDRLSPRIFQGVLAEITVRTVLRDYRQQKLPDETQYSVVDGILRVLTSEGSLP